MFVAEENSNLRGWNMSSQRDLKISLFVMVVLFITGIICYAAFDPPAPQEPVRIMFQNKAGEVLFSHSEHIDGYGLYCIDCHHNIDYDEVYDCSECHYETGDEYQPSRADALHESCIGCHEDYGAGPGECSSCHVQ